MRAFPVVLGQDGIDMSFDRVSEDVTYGGLDAIT